ncbi:MAG: hypothetical protein HJJLKODD_03005 [Phycisphaerae bacterium]|nr:hypothetical protein [Phycisphaerae bacterium]
MTPIENILSQLHHVKMIGKDKWQARCPAHNDRTPSLSIMPGDDGRILLKCHAGCTTQSVIQAAGLKMADLFDGTARVKSKPSQLFENASDAVTALERKHGRRAAIWTYYDGMGDPLGAVVRWDTPIGKTLRPISRNGSGWVIEAMPEPRPLYQLPGLADDELVLVCEGEKCSDAATQIGFASTTSSGGSQAARKTDWTPLAGKEVVIFPDNDSAGEKYLADVIALLSNLKPRPTVKVVRLPDLPDSGDIVDFVESRRAAGQDDAAIYDEIQSMIDNAGPVALNKPTDVLINNNDGGPSPVLIDLATVSPEPVTWLWPGKFARKKFSMIVGNPGCGKSFLTLDVIARVTTGRGWPDRRGEQREPGSAILLTGEDDLADTVVPRLMAIRADLTRVRALSAIAITDDEGRQRERFFCLDRDIPQLKKAIESVNNCQLIVIDPLQCYLGEKENNAVEDIRSITAALTKLATDYNVAIIGVTHWRKSGESAILRAIGSIAWVAAARCAWGVVRDPLDESGRRRLFLPIKSNLYADTDGLAYSIRSDWGETPVVAWELAPVKDNIDDLLEARTKPGKPGPKPQAQEDAIEWLKKALADGPRQANDVTTEAREAEGIPKSTLNRARKAAGVEAFRLEPLGPWWWRIKSQSQQPDDLDHLDNLVQQPEHLEYLDNVALLNEKPRLSPDAPDTLDTQVIHGDEFENLDVNGPPPYTDDDAESAQGREVQEW